MRNITIVVAALTLSACSCTTEPAQGHIKPDSAKVSKVEVCRSGFTITAGRNGAEDSTYTGCTG